MTILNLLLRYCAIAKRGHLRPMYLIIWLEAGADVKRGKGGSFASTY